MHYYAVMHDAVNGFLGNHNKYIILVGTRILVILIRYTVQLHIQWSQL